MSLLKYVDRLKRMDDLIRRKATGTPVEFSRKLGICKSMLMINLTELKQMGAPLKYDHSNQTYCYDRTCRLIFEFKLDQENLKVIKGGENFFCDSNNIRL